MSVALILSLTVASAATAFPWFDPTVPIESRLSSLVDAMTVDEMVGQLHADTAGVPRLGVPAYDFWSEALHGVAWAGNATVFPQPIAMAAAFDPSLAYQVGRAIGVEGRAKHNIATRSTNSSGRYYGLTFYAPTINIFRDPRWGRGSETYGEDPTLQSALAVAFIEGMQGLDLPQPGACVSGRSSSDLEPPVFD